MKKLYIIYFLFFGAIYLNAQSLQINEVLTKNATSIQDDLGENSDWIEIYNPNTEAVSLKGYSLSDDVNNKQKWTFKNGTIAPDSFIVVFANDISKDSLVGREKSVDDMGLIGWDYSDSTDAKPGTSAVRYTHFKKTAFGKIDGKPAMAAELFYGTPGSLGYSYLGAHLKFKDWDAEIDRSKYDKLRVYLYLEKDKKANIRFAQTGLDDWKNFTYTLTGRGDTSWYEIPIKGNVGALNLSKLTGLTIVPVEGTYNISFKFILFNVVFSQEAVDHFQTNFKLSASGDKLYLSNPTNEVVDAVQIPVLISDVSFGRKTENSLEWTIFEAPTPEHRNSGKTSNGICSKAINFSLNSGFYNGSQTLILNGATSIHYTLDGSKPTSSSTSYTAPISITKSTVLKAICTDNQSIPKEVFTNTYFIDYQTKLPVWSLSTNPENFFDDETGIYVLGPKGTYEEVSPNYGANFWEDWEKPVHIEFFENTGNQAFELDCGVKVFGNYSRANPKKSLVLNFKSEYGPSKLEYPLYPEFPGLTTFDDILLRGSGGDEAFLHFRDGFNATLAKNLNFETQKYRPSVLFINGEYWGIHNIREKSNQDYFEENKNIDKNDIDIITSYFVDKSGPTAEEFETFHAQVRNNQLTYAQIKDKIDVESFIDYQLFEIYIGNYDWPANNTKYWRQSSTKGKWRWFMYDTDFSTSIYDQKETKYDHNHFLQATTFTAGQTWPTSDDATLLLRKLILMPEFKKQFVNRYCDLINTLFVPENVFSQLQKEVLDLVSDEIPVNRARWNLDQDEWTYFLQQYKMYWAERPAYARQHMKGKLILDKEVNLSLKISPEGAGYIKLNSIEINDPSWTGIYYKGIPVNIEAIPNYGYTFDSWNSSVLALTNLTTSKIVNFDLTGDNIFTAYFTGTKLIPNITISEINYHSPNDFDTKDWIELHNYGTAPLDISGYIVKDIKLYNKYVFPEGTIIPADGRIIVSENQDSFKLVHKDMSTIGNLGFGFDNGGEKIFLLNRQKEIVQQVDYDDNSPWSVYADGNGGTLELISSGSDVTQVSSWTSVCFGGSPSLAYDPKCPQGFTYTNDYVETQQYALSPNPSHDLIYISANKDFDLVEIYHVNGLKMGEYTSNKIDVSSFPIGLYIAHVTKSDNLKETLKFIKE